MREGKTKVFLDHNYSFFSDPLSAYAKLAGAFTSGVSVPIRWIDLGLSFFRLGVWALMTWVGVLVRTGIVMSKMRQVCVVVLALKSRLSVSLFTLNSMINILTMMIVTRDGNSTPLLSSPNC